MTVTSECRPALPPTFLDSALDLIERVGWDAITIEILADHVGVSRADALRVFPSREFFRAAVVERLFADLPEEFVDEIDESSDLRDRLHAIIGHELRSMARYKRFMRELLGDAMSPFSHAALVQLPTIAKYVAFVAEQIQSARACGEVSRFVVPHIAAGAFWLVHLRIIAFWTEDASHHSEASFALADRYITTFVRTLGAPERIRSEPPAA